MLEETPRQPTLDGRPQFGTYAGRCPDARLQLERAGVPWLRRLVSRKRWHWFGAFDDDVAVGGALVDAGFFANAFLWLFDRTTGTLYDESVVVPASVLRVTTHPTVGTLARVAVPGYRLSLDRRGETLAIEGSFGDIDCSLELVADDERAMTAVCPVAGRQRGVNVTQKEVGLPATGDMSVEDGSSETFSLDGTGLVDYTHGLLARQTEWEWAIGTCETGGGTTVGFNLVDGFNDGRENVVWRDGVPERVGSATVSVPENETDAWHAATDCGTVDMSLSVEGNRIEDIDLGVVRSEYRQPLGEWTGTVAGHEVTGVGVAEEHLVRW